MSHNIEEDIGPPDELVEAFIAAHPDGGSNEAIAEVLGVTRERIYQILRCAMRKAKKKLDNRGMDVTDLPRERENLWDRMQSS